MNRCFECGRQFHAVRKDQMFCSKKCRIKHYRGITKSEYCIDCPKSYQSHDTRWICRKTGKIVVGITGRATINAMNC